MRVSLADKLIRGLAFDPSDRSNTYFDLSVKGLAVRVYPTGAKSFLFKHQVNGRQKMVTLGSATELTLSKAKKAALEVLRKPQDGLSSFKKITVDKFSDLYLERYAKPNKKTWDSDETRLRLYVKREWGSRYIHEITRDDCATLLTQIGVTEEKPIQANRVRELLCVVFDCAKNWGNVPMDFDNPARYFKDFKENKRTEFLTAEQVTLLFSELQKENMVFQGYFTFILMTGIRRTEALKLRWEHVFWDQNVFYSEMSKDGNPAWYPLTPGLKMLLNELPRKQNNPFLFPGWRQGKRLNNVQTAWERIRERIGAENIHIHDLRHSCDSLLADQGESLPIIGKCLNHNSLESTKRYAHISDPRVVAAFEKLHAHLILKRPPNKNAPSI